MIIEIARLHICLLIILQNNMLRSAAFFNQFWIVIWRCEVMWYLNFRGFLNYQNIVMCHFGIIRSSKIKKFKNVSFKLRSNHIQLFVNYIIVCKNKNKHADMMYKNYILTCFFLRWVKLYIFDMVKDYEKFLISLSHWPCKKYTKQTKTFVWDE